MRVAGGRIWVGATAGKVGGRGVAGAGVAGTPVGVFNAARCVRAKMVAATTVPTSLGELVGSEGADPRQAAVRRPSVHSASMGRSRGFEFMGGSPWKFAPVYGVQMMAGLMQTG